MRFIRLCTLLAVLVPEICVAQHTRSIGVPPYQEAQPASLRLLYGMGGNLGQLNSSPSLANYRLTYQTSSVFWGLGFISSSGNNGPYAFPTTMSEFDLLIGYSWDEQIPRYEAPPVAIHYALASGLAIDSYTRMTYFSFGDGFGYNEERTSASFGLPLEFSAIYEPFDFVGVGVLAFVNLSAFTPSYGGSVVLEARF